MMNNYHIKFTEIIYFATSKKSTFSKETNKKSYGRKSTNQLNNFNFLTLCKLQT